MPTQANDIEMHRIVNLFRYLDIYISNNPQILEKEGVFRIPCKSTVRNTLLDEFYSALSKKTTDNLISFFETKASNSTITIHELLGLIPRALDKFTLVDLGLQIESDTIAKWKSIIDNSSQQDSSEIIVGLFTRLIHDFLTSNDIKLQRTGEIIYRYLHIMKISLEYSDVTKMHADNLGRIAGMNIVNLLKLTDENSSDYLTKIDNINSLMSIIIQSDFAKEDFDKKYSQLAAHLLQTKEIYIERLSKEITSLQSYNKSKILFHEHDELKVELREYTASFRALYSNDKKNKKCIEAIYAIESLDGDINVFENVSIIERSLLKASCSSDTNNQDLVAKLKSLQTIREILIRIFEIKTIELPRAVKQFPKQTAIVRDKKEEKERMVYSKQKFELRSDFGTKSVVNNTIFNPTIGERTYKKKLSEPNEINELSKNEDRVETPKMKII